MSGPIVFISHNTIHQGKLAAFEEAADEMIPMIERDKPGTVVFLAYTSQDGSELHMVHAFPDTEAMARHLDGVDDRVAAVAEAITTTGYEIYGSPGEQVLAAMQGFADAQGIPLVVRPGLIGGYLRPSA